MNTIRTTNLQDSKVDEKIVLSGLWISMLFVFAYVDILGFWRTDVINGALAGRVPGTELGVDQTFLALSTVYILIPTLMVVVSLLVPAKANRLANIIVSLLYLASVVATVIGESWIYYILGSVVEVVLLLAITRIACNWQEPTSHPLPRTSITTPRTLPKSEPQRPPTIETQPSTLRGVR